jgi:hypothetical protein
MSGLIWLWWLGAVALSGVGTWLVLRGLFGHRRIASRTRRCPRCRYDMTGRPGEMTCAECGFTAQHEARFYGGKRRWWVAGLGLVVCVGGLGMLVVPESVERRGVAWLLPRPVQRAVLAELIARGDRSAERLLVDAARRLRDDQETAADLELLQVGLQHAAREMAALNLTRDRAVALSRVTRVYPSISWAIEIELSTEEIGRLINSPHRGVVEMGCSYLVENPADVPLFRERLIEIGSADASNSAGKAFMALVRHGIESGNTDWPEGMFEWMGATRGYGEWAAIHLLGAEDEHRDWVMARLREGNGYALDAFARMSSGWRRLTSVSDEEIQPVVEALVALLTREDVDHRNTISSTLENARDVHVPIIAAGLEAAETPRAASRILSVLNRFSGDASASLPYVEAYALDPDLPFNWAKRAADDHRSIRSRFDAEDDHEPIFAMPIYRRALAATDWDDPRSVARLMIEWSPHRHDGTVALAELIAAGDPSPFVVALAADAAEYYDGDLIERLTRIARDDRLADETRAIAGRLAGELEDVWPGLIAADGGAP